MFCQIQRATLEELNGHNLPTHGLTIVRKDISISMLHPSQHHDDNDQNTLGNQNGKK